MKTTSLKTIYLTADELKQALVEYLEKTEPELAQHLYDNECEMVWGQDGKEFLISIDGEIKDRNTETDICDAADKVIEDHKETLQKLADTPLIICDACGCKVDKNNAKVISDPNLSGVWICSNEDTCQEMRLKKADHKMGCYVWTGGECICKPKSKAKTFYADGVDWQHHDKFKLHSSPESIKKNSSCWEECGIVKVSVTEDEWIEEQRIFKEKNTKWYNCAHCDAGYIDQECTCPQPEEE